FFFFLFFLQGMGAGLCGVCVINKGSMYGLMLPVFFCRRCKFLFWGFLGFFLFLGLFCAGGYCFLIFT
ncbi:hypothetical protein LXA30_17630, partial [Erwinia amylovora]|uniref:hypothetical protein n=1 Tax=Erwinia amylovora TaxID=552 RepID=UPI0020C08C80